MGYLYLHYILLCNIEVVETALIEILNECLEKNY